VGFVALDREFLHATLGQLKGPALSVLVALMAHRSDGEGTAFPSLQTLAGWTGISRRAVIMALKRLVGLRLVSIERRTDAAGDADSNTYTLDVARIEGHLGGGELHAPPNARRALPGGELRAPRVVNYVHPKESHLKESHSEGETPARGAGVRTGHDGIRRAVADHFAERTGLDLPAMDTDAQRKSAGAAWWGPIREICAVVGWRQVDAQALVDASIARLRKSRCSIAEPRSIIKTARSIVAEVKRGAYRPEDEARGLGDLRRLFAAEVVDGQRQTD
jgi:hypothetical protein